MKSQMAKARMSYNTGMGLTMNDESFIQSMIAEEQRAPKS
jgi:hypothetical protein